MGIYEVESFFLALEQLHGSLSDIGAHQDFQKPEFIMPELLQKELSLFIHRRDLSMLLYTLFFNQLIADSMTRVVSM